MRGGIRNPPQEAVTLLRAAMSQTQHELSNVENRTDRQPSQLRPGISPPIGGIKKRGRPRSSTRLALCEAMNISVRNLERAVRIRRSGITELVTLIERGELGCGPAEIIATLPHGLQREIVARGAAFIRRVASELRRRP